MTHQPLTKAEREDLRRLHESAADATWSKRKFADLPITDCQLAVAARNALPRLLADLDAAEAERDEIKSALGVMGATRERVLEVAGSQDALEERIESMRRERDVALSGWSAAEAARDAAAAQRDRAEAERDALKRMHDALQGHHNRMHGELQSILGDEDSVLELAKKVVAERDALKAKLADRDDVRELMVRVEDALATERTEPTQ